MFGVVYARGITYGTVPRIPAVSSPCGESSFLDDMAATENPILGEGSRQMAHDGRQFDDYIADGDHDGRQFDDNIAEGEDEVYVADQITRNEEGNPNADTLLKYPTQCEDTVTPTCTDEYGRPAGQAEAPKGDLSNQGNTCKFPVMETGWEINVEDVQDNDPTEINQEKIPIQCEEDLHLTRYNDVSGCLSRDYGAPDSCSHGGARSRPATQGRLQMRQTVLYAQCEEDLFHEYTWKLEEGDRLRRSLLCPECHTSPWSVVLIPVQALTTTRFCPLTRTMIAKMVLTDYIANELFTPRFLTTSACCSTAPININIASLTPSYFSRSSFLSLGDSGKLQRWTSEAKLLATELGLTGDELVKFVASFS
ncbi:hypothetical protein C0Q70_10869 [Pomacea canaliculata]|uniref:Uncharacterized protein n=1 Tax=Pomacea canaliculata TaxID=400727 RepID=A0A2T7P4C9_POMCA|nr:hypothetical protein C0Q70_10869 [Pomacea canaliculata]